MAAEPYHLGHVGAGHAARSDGDGVGGEAPRSFSGTCPERERAEFLRQYHEAVDAAHDPAGYRRLQQLLHAGRLTVIATSRAGYYEELEAVGGGTAQSRPAEEVIPGWQERLAAAGAQMR